MIEFVSRCPQCQKEVSDNDEESDGFFCGQCTNDLLNGPKQREKDSMGRLNAGKGAGSNPNSGRAWRNYQQPPPDVK